MNFFHFASKDSTQSISLLKTESKDFLLNLEHFLMVQLYQL